jgi:hypothetical protein
VASCPVVCVPLRAAARDEAYAAAVMVDTCGSRGRGKARE